MTVPAHTNTTTAAEVLRDELYVAHAESWYGSEWPDAKDCGGCTRQAERLAQSLAAAGLLADPTTRTEWGAVVCGEVCRHDTEQAARDCARTLGQGQIVRREVTAWTTVADTPAADDEGGQER